MTESFRKTGETRPPKQGRFRVTQGRGEFMRTIEGIDGNELFADVDEAVRWALAFSRSQSRWMDEENCGVRVNDLVTQKSIDVNWYDKSRPFRNDLYEWK